MADEDNKLEDISPDDDFSFDDDDFVGFGDDNDDDEDSDALSFEDETEDNEEKKEFSQKASSSMWIWIMVAASIGGIAYYQFTKKTAPPPKIKTHHNATEQTKKNTKTELAIKHVDTAPHETASSKAVPAGVTSVSSESKVVTTSSAMDGATAASPYSPYGSNTTTATTEPRKLTVAASSEDNKTTTGSATALAPTMASKATSSEVKPPMSATSGIKITSKVSKEIKQPEAVTTYPMNQVHSQVKERTQPGVPLYNDQSTALVANRKSPVGSAPLVPSPSRAAKAVTTTAVTVSHPADNLSHGASSSVPAMAKQQQEEQVKQQLSELTQQYNQLERHASQDSQRLFHLEKSVNTLNQSMDQLNRNLKKMMEKMDKKPAAKKAMDKSAVSPRHSKGPSTVTTSKGSLSSSTASVKGRPHTATTSPKTRQYYVSAAIPGRAWVRTPAGGTITLKVGDTLPEYGQVIKIDANQGIVSTSSGRVIDYGIDEF